MSDLPALLSLESLMPLAIGIGIFFFFLMGIAALYSKFYVKVSQGTALIVNDMSAKPKVHFTGAMVYPIIYKRELMKISLITLEVDRRGKDGLICADNMRADITVAFYLRVNETVEDVLQVAKSIGADRASDRDAVDQLFNAKFSEALKTAGKQMQFVNLFENRQEFRDKIIEVIGDDLNGYVLEDVAIDYLEQTPKSSLDPNNILDAEGIKKITELTTVQNVRTNMLERDEELAIKKKNVQTVEAMLELERQQADAQARQKREVASIQAREEAETKRAQEEGRLKAESARIEVEQDIRIQTENQQREVEIAEQNRQRAVAIEEEKVTRARDLEIVNRERDVELQRIEAEKAVEVEKKAIADVIRERVAVDKTVAIEEERIKEVRLVSEADRAKQVEVLVAESEAMQEAVKQIKAAEAEEQSAQHKAAEITLIAQAQLEEAEKNAEAKIKLAEGIQAEHAAAGLAEARVLEARGHAEAKALLGTGNAQAEVTKAQFRAEADGLEEKFEAMNRMSDDARAHEEFRIGLETALKEALAAIEAGKDIARDNAEVLATALQKAKIDIVGGEEHFFDNFARSLSIGKAVDGLAGKSNTISALISRALMGNTSSGGKTAAVPATRAKTNGKDKENGASKRTGVTEEVNA